MEKAAINVSELEVYGGGEHWSRFYPVFSEFTFEHAESTRTYPEHLKHVTTKEDLVALIKATLESVSSHTEKEYEKFMAQGDGGAARFMESFGNWAPKYFIDVARDANKQLEKDQKISPKDIGGTFVEALEKQRRLDNALLDMYRGRK